MGLDTSDSPVIHPNNAHGSSLAPAADANPTDSATEKMATDAAAQPLQDLPAVAPSDDPDIKDLGFQSERVDSNPLFKGLTNEELWLCVRRFSKQTFHLRAIPTVPPGGLDMVPAEEPEFSADKLRAEFERLYMTTFVGGASFFKHIARLRSWRERNRTLAFLVAYSVAWYSDLVIPAFLTMLMLLVAVKPLRHRLFPPAPLALVSAKHGGLQEPKAGLLGSTDSLTGAPENHKGEAVEHEASQFITGVTSVAVSAAMGKSGSEPADVDSEDEDTPPKGENALPDPTTAIAGLADARGIADQSKPAAENDQTKVATQTAIWDATRPLLQGLGALSDTQERFANALSPTPPFSRLPRYRLAACFVPMILGASIAEAHWVSKGMFAIVGFLFFGQPAMTFAFKWLNEHVPNWFHYLEVQNTLLQGVPTNAQLTIALLRIAEAHKAPIPPPPSGSKPPPGGAAHHEVATIAKDNALASEEEIRAAALGRSNDNSRLPVEPPSAVKQGKAVGILKGAAAGIISMGGGKAHVEATTIGNERAKNRLGALPGRKDKKLDGPSRFRARFHGHKGHAVINSSAVTPSVAFSKGYDTDDSKPLWTLQIEDLRELKKSSGLGWKTKIVVGAVLKRETADAIDIVDAQGNTYKLTALPRRDELFNRLAAMGNHKWVMV